MRRALLTCFCVSGLMIAGCSRQPEPVVAPPPPPPSAWVMADSASVADELVPLLLKRSWVSDFKQRTGNAPKIALGQISDRSQGAIDGEVYASQLRRALGADSTVLLVDTREAADFLLKGSVGANDGNDGDLPVRRYQIDLTVIERASGDIATPTVSIEKQKDDRALMMPAAQP
jgi:hypothetical protein